MNEHAKLDRDVTLAGAVVILLIAICMVLDVNFNYDLFLVLIFLSGALGAAVNNFRYFAARTKDDGKNVTTFRVYASLVIGGVLGIVLYATCVSGLVGGKLFPEFKATENTFQNLRHFVIDGGPQTNLDAAKALLWAFIAGMFQRTVPGMLGAVARGVGGEKQEA